MTIATKELMILADEVIMNKIFIVRGQRVMLDRDLADLYNVETKVLKQAVRRNAARFPIDFMFEMNKKEFEKWRSQFVTSNNSDRMGLRYAPFCFTELGVTMLSCILNSERAITINIQIIRIFAKLREMMMTNTDILLKLEQLEKNVTSHAENIQMIFKAFKQFLNHPKTPMKRIGLRRGNEDD